MKSNQASDMDRRAFLKGMTAGAGCIFSASALSALGADDPGVFPYRGSVERLVLAYQHIHIGLERPFSVLHISDTHLTAVDEDEFDKTDFARFRTNIFGGRQEEALRDSLAWARKNVDYVIHTGDLIDFQTRANLRLAKKYFGLSEGRMTGAMGNHEFQRRKPGEALQRTVEYNALSAADLKEAFPFDPELQSTVINGVNFVAIEQVYGFVTERQVERFEAEVKKGLPIILCMHAPLMTDEIWRFERKYWKGPGKKYSNAAIPDPEGDYTRQLGSPVTMDFIKNLKSQPLLKGILAGHLHLTAQDRFSPTAIQYVVGGNFLFHGEEVLFS